MMEGLMIKFLTTTSDENHPGLLKLIKSLQLFGWDYTVIKHEWRGFGDKLIATYEYLKLHPEINEFVYSDAFDSVCLGTEKEVSAKWTDRTKILWAAERACYPHGDLSNQYPEAPHSYKYLNGGQWISSRENFLDFYERNPPHFSVNDQAHSTDIFLNYNSDSLVKLDYNCAIFQAYSFINDNDYTYCNHCHRITNNETNSQPVFFHGNGHTPLDLVYKIINV